MSRENVELVRNLQPDGLDLVEAFAAGASEMMDEDQRARFADDFEVHFASEMLAKVAKVDARGPEGLTAMWRDWLTPWKYYRLDVEDIIDAGDDVVVFVRVQARTERDDVLVQHAPAAIWSIREGQVAGITFYLDRAEALQAAGLSEELARKSG
jgi:ketosteroid isomerase-like protein